MAVYLIIFPAGIFVMWRIARKGPAAAESSPIESGRPSQPITVELHQGRTS
jgi:cytochrome d ubiquinol oxidase subunit I